MLNVLYFLMAINIVLILGSANLTDTGLSSIGELGCLLTDNDDVSPLIKHLYKYIENSSEWASIINDYAKLYKKYRPKIHKTGSRKGTSKKTYRGIPKATDVLINISAPSIGKLISLTKEEQQKLRPLIDRAVKGNNKIAKSGWILWWDKSPEEVEKDYPKESWFDRHSVGKVEWHIGTKRSLTKVGLILPANKKDVLMLMEKGSLYYKVSQASLALAKKCKIFNNEHPTKSPSCKTLPIPFDSRYQ